MNIQNKKEKITSLHRETILKAAKSVFSIKGFSAATIDDISKASQYSRRTLYTYFLNKEDILNHIVLEGLLVLKGNIVNALAEHSTFLERYFSMCQAIKDYSENYPHSNNAVSQMDNKDIKIESITPVVERIFSTGSVINQILAAFIQNGKEEGVIRAEVIPMQTVYILWSSISSLLSLIHLKGEWIEKEFSITTDAFLDYGLTQIINSILETRI